MFNDFQSPFMPMDVAADVDANPFQIQGLTDIVAISASPEPFSKILFALKSDGTVWAIGYNNDGQLGDGTTVDRNIPVKVRNLNNVVAISAGYNHSLALKSDGTVWVWGFLPPDQKYVTPVQVKGITDAVGISAGKDYSLILRSDGTVWGFGANDVGQLGDGPDPVYKTPIKFKI